MDPPWLSVHNPSHQYLYRIPSPPRIFVPPPILTSIDSPSATAGATSRLQPTSQFSHYAFLSSSPFKYPVPRERVVDWNYGERQQAQEILPFLFLGSLAAARDAAFLQAQKITLVIGMRRVMDGLMLNPRAPRDLGLEMRFADITTQADLFASFGQVVNLVNEHVEKRFLAAQADAALSPGRVLVFCESGNERSATAVAAYIMTVYGLGLVEAVQIVQGQRFCINIDDSMRSRLETYSHILAAQRDVLEANGGRQTVGSHGNGSLTPPGADRIVKKRSAGRMFDEEDEEMEDVVDEQDTKRDGNAPFSDEPVED